MWQCTLSRHTRNIQRKHMMSKPNTDILKKEIMFLFFLSLFYEKKTDKVTDGRGAGEGISPITIS